MKVSNQLQPLIAIQTIFGYTVAPVLYFCWQLLIKEVPGVYEDY